MIASAMRSTCALNASGTRFTGSSSNEIYFAHETFPGIGPASRKGEDMRRRSLLLGFVAMTACSRKEAPNGASSEGKEPPREEHAQSTDPGCALPAASILSSDVSIKAGCRVIVERSYQVQNGATLAIE